MLKKPKNVENRNNFEKNLSEVEKNPENAGKFEKIGGIRGHPKIFPKI